METNMRYIQSQYNKQIPFASFLPGIAGTDGIPMWVYYVNRGQAIAGFGIRDKLSPMLDFVPANVAYQRNETIGFRTFIKHEKGIYEPFRQHSDGHNELIVEPHWIGLKEKNEALGIEVEVIYSTIVQQPYAGLIRRTIIRSKNPIEVLDGTTTFYPSETNDFAIKQMRNLAVAWMAVDDVDGMKVFKNRSSTEDSSKIEMSASAHVVISFEKNNQSSPIITDIINVFGQDTSLQYPEHFANHSLEECIQTQQTTNQVPCAFSTAKGTEIELVSVFTYVPDVSNLGTIKKSLTYEFILAQETANHRLMSELLSNVSSHTAMPKWDAYVKQAFLDNTLRGGYPMVFRGKKTPIVYHVYSRIHGDMEREYNDFVLEPRYFSQGNGNFRDVIQNRRNDVLFHPETGRYNLHAFIDLIQLDGYNPLVIQGSELLYKGDRETLSASVKDLVDHPFSLGELADALIQDQQPLTTIETILGQCSQSVVAHYGHGYWIDHWTYINDLLEQYVKVFPDQINDVLFREPFAYFASPHTVKPFLNRVVLTPKGLRQYDALELDEERQIVYSFVDKKSHWERVRRSRLTTSLFAKLLFLATIKFYTFDPARIGIMMEADKPGWNDAMNGLPGLFGSCVSETIELQRLMRWLEDQTFTTIEVPIEWRILFDEVPDVQWFDQQETIKEQYRESIRLGLSGKTYVLSVVQINTIIKSILKTTETALHKAASYGEILPTFLLNTPVHFDPNVIPREWMTRALPVFLEAPARIIRSLTRDEAIRLHDRILQSELYDHELGLFKTSVSLEEESMEIGRIRAFTPGWLERESSFLHMQYKYLLGLYHQGLINEFFEFLFKSAPVFMNDKVYGRNPIENVSFIATSNNPNAHVRGRGFVARLTGTNTEILSIWLSIMVGNQWFTLDNGELEFSIQPQLPASLFDQGVVEFMLFQSIRVRVLNATGKDTFGVDRCHLAAYRLEGELMNSIKGEDAKRVRERQIKEIEVIYQ